MEISFTADKKSHYLIRILHSRLPLDFFPSRDLLIILMIYLCSNIDSYIITIA